MQLSLFWSNFPPDSAKLKYKIHTRGARTRAQPSSIEIILPVCFIKFFLLAFIIYFFFFSGTQVHEVDEILILILGSN